VTYIWKETYCYYYRSAAEIDERHKRDISIERDLPKVTYTYEKGLLLRLQKASEIDTLYTYIYAKRPTIETYKKTYKRDKRKRSTKETYKRDQAERTTKSTYKMTHKRDIQKTHIYLKRDLQN